MTRSAVLFCFIASTSLAAVVADVRSKLSANDLSSAEAIAEDYYRASGGNSEYAAALSWLARGAVMMGNTEAATRYLAETKTLLKELSKNTRVDGDRFLETATGACIEVEAQLLEKQQGRDQAVAFLSTELERWKKSPLERRIQKRLNILTIEGKPAPELDRRYSGKPVLIFLWAHWCSDCKAQSFTLSRLKEKYGKRGLQLIAPTRRYGVIPDNDHATPEQEDREIEQTWKTTYAGLGDAAHPVSDAMMLRYGVSSTPTLVLVDSSGIVRMYRPYRMSERELSAAIEPLLPAR
jgi:thiol-disulfide isomerase/thioredoxin